MSLAIETCGLTKHFAETVAVVHLDLRIPRGEIFGLLGPNGSGKTTTLRMLLGLITPTEGTASVLGYSVADEARAIRGRAGALLEHDGLYDRFSAYGNLDYFGQIHHLEKQQRRKRVECLLRDIGLWDRREEPVSKWSKGMRQRLAIARALMHDPEIVFFDEPTSGLDPGATREVRQAIQHAAEARKKTFFICTHHLDEAERLCSLVGVINQGKLVACDAPDRLRDAMSQPRVAFRCRDLSHTVVDQIIALPFVRQAELEDGALHVELDEIEKTGEVVRFLVHAGVDVNEVYRPRKTLEEAFLTLVDKD